MRYHFTAKAVMYPLKSNVEQKIVKNIKKKH